MSLDPKANKNDFPLLSRSMNGKPLVYLDSAATTQKPGVVIDALARFYRDKNANIHRGVYTLSEEATALYETTRKKVAGFIHAPTAESLVFTKNATESINLVAHSWGRKHLKEGDEILLSEMEHHANFVPWYLLSKEKKIALKILPLKENHSLDLEAYKKLLTPRVKLVAITAMSNVLGTINDLDGVIELAHKNKAVVVVDGAQSVPHLATNVKDMGCDFFAFSAHKMLGPTGVGVLWVKPRLLDAMDPFMGGGEMINSVRVEEITWAEAPLKFEPGTPNYAGVVAFGAALDYLEKIGLPQIRAHEKELTAYALDKLLKNAALKIYGPKDPEKQGGILSFNHSIVHAHDVGTILSDQGVAIRVGHHCAQPLMKALGVSSTARASFYIYNTEEDVDRLLEALGEVDRIFQLEGAPAS